MCECVYYVCPTNLYMYVYILYVTKMLKDALCSKYVYNIYLICLVHVYKVARTNTSQHHKFMCVYIRTMCTALLSKMSSILRTLRRLFKLWMIKEKRDKHTHTQTTYMYPVCTYIRRIYLCF